jgi:hypothetical protein
MLKAHREKRREEQRRRRRREEKKKRREEKKKRVFWFFRYITCLPCGLPRETSPDFPFSLVSLLLIEMR